MPKKQIIRRLILAAIGFLIVILERIIAELSPPGEGTAPILNHPP